MSEVKVSNRQITGRLLYEKLGRLYFDFDETVLKLNIAIGEMAKLSKENRELKEQIAKLKLEEAGGDKSKVTDITEKQKEQNNGND